MASVSERWRVLKLGSLGVSLVNPASSAQEDDVKSDALALNFWLMKLGVAAWPLPSAAPVLCRRSTSQLAAAVQRGR